GGKHVLAGAFTAKEGSVGFVERSKFAGVRRELDAHLSPAVEKILDNGIRLGCRLSWREDGGCAKHLESTKGAHLVVNVEILLDPCQRLCVEKLHGLPEGVVCNIALNGKRDAGCPEFREGFDSDRGNNTPGCSSTATESPEEIGILHFVGN